MAMMVPEDEKSNPFDDTLMSPAHATDWVSRFPIHATVNTGRKEPVANINVKNVAPERTLKKLPRPPQKSPNPPRNSLPSAYASTPREVIEPRRITASPWSTPRSFSSSMMSGAPADRSGRQKYNAA